MIEKERVKKLIEERIAGTDIFLVSLTISSSNDIHVVLDADSGLSIDKCISVSRNIEHNLDREAEDFSLEVGSFVLGHPLLMIRQYKKYINKMVSVTDNLGVNYKGILLKVDESSLELKQELSKKKLKEGVDPHTIMPYEKLKEIKAVITF